MLAEWLTVRGTGRRNLRTHRLRSEESYRNSECRRKGEKKGEERREEERPVDITLIRDETNACELQ